MAQLMGLSTWFRASWQIELLEALHASWLEYEGTVEKLKNWFAAQEERLKKKHIIEDLASVQNALKDCQVTPPLFYL